MACPFRRERQREIGHGQERGRHGHRGDDRGKAEAEASVMLPQTKEAWSPQRLVAARKPPTALPCSPQKEPV